MTEVHVSPALAVAKDLLSGNPDGLKELVRAVLQEVLEAEMTEAIGAAKGERSAERRGYRAGHYPRTLVTRVGKLELRVPQDREGRFSTDLFQRYQRSEQALVAALAQMYVQGVSTRKVKAITEELCGHAFSASAISDINKTLDESLEAFARRRLEEPLRAGFSGTLRIGVCKSLKMASLRTHRRGPARPSGACGGWIAALNRSA